ncbi:MAG TPA: chloride channel protein [Sphingomicrobium sp.]
MRRLRVLARRHGPTSPVWRRRMAMGTGGALVGLVAILFAEMANAAIGIFKRDVASIWWLPLIVTPLGVVVIAIATRRFTPEGRGSGIPQVIAATSDPENSRSTLISLRVGIAKLLMTAAGLLAGASVGREGPTVQVSAAIMTRVHRVFRVPVTAGVIIAGGAAGVAGAFNTPLAGVAFAIEELANAFEQKVALLVMTAILIAGIVSIGIAGDYIYFGTMPSTIGLGRTLVIAPVAGVLGGMSGGLFSRLVLAITYRRERILGPLAKRPVAWALICGILIALIGIATQVTWGTGYSEAKMAIEGAPETLWFGPGKFAATLLSTVAGLPGGIFSPSLATGAGVGNLLCLLFPHDPRGAVVLLGMVAYFTGVVRAPLTAVIIIVEATASRGMILPLFASSLIADAAGRLVCKEKLYHALAREFLSCSAASA